MLLSPQSTSSQAESTVGGAILGSSVQVFVVLNLPSSPHVYTTAGSPTVLSRHLVTQKT